MKKKSATTTVYRMDLEKGNYTTVARAILLNNNLTDSAKTLLQLCLNNVEGWKLSLNYYKKQLKWSNDKMAGAVENLITEGYMTKDKKPNGKNGFTYIYVISEFGNLNPSKEQPSVEQIENSIESDSTSEIFIKETPILSKIEEFESNEETVANATTEQEINKEETIEKLTELLGVVEEEYPFTSMEWLQKLVDYYVDEINLGKLTIENFDLDREFKRISNNLSKQIEIENNKSRNKIIEWIDYHNTRGTIAQKKNIKERAIKYFEDNFPNKLYKVIEGNVSTRLLYLKSSIVDANRVYDSRYQD